MTMITPEITEVTNTNLDGDHERCAHIIAPDGKRSAQAIVTEARVMGVPVRAMCGKLWIPERDPERFPVCQGCIDAFEAATGRPWAGR